MTQAIENLLREERSFPPPAEFAAAANAQPGIHEKPSGLRRLLAAATPSSGSAGSRSRQWLSTTPTRRSTGGSPMARSTSPTTASIGTWRRRATRSPTTGSASRATPATLTYRDLHHEVCQFANALKSLGLKRGDRAALYMGMVPELPVAMLACARLGTVHTAVFGGFSSDALADRINDGQAKVVITMDGAWRGGKVVPLKANADVAVARTPSIEHVIVLKRTGTDVHMEEGRDLWWDDLVDGQSGHLRAGRAQRRGPALHPLHLGDHRQAQGDRPHPGRLSGRRGRPPTTTSSTSSPTDIYWCAADIGWVTGHSYIVYGPLANRTTSVIYEGAPNYPDFDRLWQIIEDYKVTILYTAPTAIRSFMKWGDEYPAARPDSAPAARDRWASRSTPRRGCGTTG